MITIKTLSVVGTLSSSWSWVCEDNTRANTDELDFGCTCFQYHAADDPDNNTQFTMNMPETLMVDTIACRDWWTSSFFWFLLHMTRLTEW